MAIDLSWKDTPVRELRLGSITGYNGLLSDMALEGCNGCLKNKGRDFQTASLCSHMHLIGQLVGLTGAAVVDHAPIGCTGAQVQASLPNYRYEPNKGEPLLENSRVMSTGLNEKDTIFGALDKLRAAVRATYELHRPKEIYITSSCVSAIIGEDIHSVAEELSEELGIPVVTATGEGFRSKVWASGFDAFCHAAARAKFKSKKKTRNPKMTLNYVGFSSIGRKYVDPIFARLGLEVIYITAYATTEDFQRATKSIATLGQCGAQSTYICGILEKEFGVKYFQEHLPYGAIGFDRFFGDLGKFLGKEDVVGEIIAEEKEKYGARIEELRKKLQGKTAVIALGASFAYEYTRLLKELGVQVLHTVAYHYDPVLDNLNQDEKVAAATDVIELKLDVPTSVNDAQQQETNLVINKYKPDFIISRAHEAGVFAILQGIPAIDVEVTLNMIGRHGLVRIGTLISEMLRNENFFKKLGKRYISPFTQRYDQTAPFSFYREEEAL